MHRPYLLLRTATLCATIGSLVAADIDFANPHAAYVTGSGPRTVTIGTLDGNGSNDLVVGNGYSDTISILLNNGDGTFATKTDSAVPGNPSSVAIVDLNGDGKNDVVVANQITAGCISVFLGNGDGTFQTRVDHTASANPVAMRVADMDADGEPDVIVAGTGLGFFKGLGDGTFAAMTTILNTGYANSVTVGHLDGDTKMDIAVTHNARLTVLLGNGDGTFPLFRTFQTGASDLSVGMGDFNGDGLNDLAETHYSGPTYEIAVLLNLGGGDFGTPATFATGVNPKSLMIGDVDADGNRDLVCVNVGSYTVGILRGKGDGTFHPHIGYLTGANPYVDALGDLDGNGSLDVAAANLSGGSVSVLLQGTGAAPGAVTSITASPVSDQYARLAWTTPMVESYGPATHYDMRLALGTMLPGGFASATPVSPGPAVGPGGTAASFVLSGLSPGTTYSVAFTTTDAFSRTSPLSVVRTFTTAATDVLPPAQSSLSTAYIGNDYCVLRWTAPGDDGLLGTAVSYDLRMSTTPITDDLTFAAATSVATTAPKASGQLEELLVSGLSDGTTYYFAITASDEVPLTSMRSATEIVLTDTGDLIAPETVNNLSVAGETSTSIIVWWTARGDDGTWGVATSYDLRWSTEPIHDLPTFLAANMVVGMPTPSPLDEIEMVTIDGLAPSTVYYTALRIGDEVPNFSGISNVVVSATLEGTAPAAITDLTISTPTTTSLALTWTAPGDDGSSGTANSYDVRYSTTPITDLGTFANATMLAIVPPPQAAGTTEHLTLTGLTAGTTYHVAILTSDEVPNTSGLSNAASGMTTASSNGSSDGSSGGVCGSGSGLATLVLLAGFMLTTRLRRH